MTSQNNGDYALVQEEFTYNSTKHSVTSKSPFKIVYLKCHKHVLDLMSIKKSVGFSVAAKKMAMDAQAIIGGCEIEVDEDQYQIQGSYRKAPPC